MKSMSHPAKLNSINKKKKKKKWDRETVAQFLNAWSAQVRFLSFAFMERCLWWKTWAACELYLRAASDGDDASEEISNHRFQGDSQAVYMDGVDQTQAVLSKEGGNPINWKCTTLSIIITSYLLEGNITET